MDFDSTNARFVVSVEDISDVWGTLKSTLEARTGWRSVQLRTRSGPSLSIPELQIRYVLSNSARLKQLRQHSQSPVTWFRKPYVQLILISLDDSDNYKKHLKAQLRQVIDFNKDLLGGAPDFVIACLQSFGNEATAKAARKVFETVRSDIGTRKKERVVRIEIGPRGAVSLASVNELEKQMAEAFKMTFSARSAAYDEAVRRLSSERQTAGWDFGDLFLVKDSLAAMLESAGLYEDALIEYVELEALYNATLPPLDSDDSPPFGGTAPGDDTAQLVRATWREARKTVWRNNELLQFDFQQFLFACQARIELKLNRPENVAKKGLAAIESLQQAMGHPAISSKLPELFKEAWTFSACISLATTAVRIGPPPPTPKPPPTPLHARIVTRMGQPPAVPNHRRHTSELPPATMQNRQRQTKSMGATEFATVSEGSTGSVAGDAHSEDLSDSEDTGVTTGLQAKDRRHSVESTTTKKRASLKPVKTRTTDTREHATDAVPNGQASESTNVSELSSATYEPSTDWQLGVNGHITAEALEEMTKQGSHSSSSGKSFKQRHFWSLLGELYLRARDSLSAFSETVEYADSITLSSPQASLNGSLQRGPSTPGTASSPLPLRSPSLRGAPSLGHILPRREIDGSESSSMGSRVPSAQSLQDVSRSQSLAKVETNPIGKTGDAVPQHSRTVSRFGREAAQNLLSLRTPSGSSLFHNRRGSAVPDTPSTVMSDAESVGSILQSGSDTIPQPDVLLRNVRLAEREVETASEGSDSPSSARMSERSGAQPHKLNWLTEWRLRLALNSHSKFQELWMDLSGAAAACYSAAGWKRQAHLMMAGVAEVLMQRGQLEPAVGLMQVNVRQLLASRWDALSSRILGLQLQCQEALDQVVSPGDCLHLVGLLSARGIQQDLQQSLQTTFITACLSIPAPLPLPLDEPHLLWAEPVGSRYSRFFGQSEEEGEPVLVASTQPPCEGLQQGNGAHVASVGDIVTVPVVIHSRFHSKIPITDCKLSLSVIQEVMVVLSPRAANADATFTRGQGHLRSMSVRSMDTLTSFPSNKSLPSIAAAANLDSRATSLRTEPGEEKKLSSRWQEAEEIVCHLEEGEANAGLNAPSASSDMQYEYEDSDVGVDQRSTDAGSPPLALSPGQNLLHFQVTPLKQGLYALKHCSFQVGKVEVKVPAKCKDNTSCGHDIRGLSPARQPSGCVDSSGRLTEESVLVHVRSTAQRVGLDSILPNLAVISNANQWIGLAVTPMHDNLADAQIQIDPVTHSSGLPTAPEHTSLALQANQDLLIERVPEGGDHRYPWQTADNEEASTSGRIGENEGSPSRFQPWSKRGMEARRLPDWAQVSPSVLWLPVYAGGWENRIQKVRISPYTSQAPLRTIQGVGEITSPLKSPLQSPDGEKMMSSQSRSNAHVDVSLEYNSGCARGTSSRITMPVMPALRVFVTGKELLGSRVVLQVSITSNLSSQLVIQSINLIPQPGFSYDKEHSDLAHLLPLKIAAEGRASLLLFLAVVDTTSEDALGRRSSRLQSSLEFNLLTNLDQPPSTAYRENRSFASEQNLQQRHNFVLDLGAASTAPQSTVYTRLLGPFAAKVGEAATFCWRLERGAAFVPSKGDTDLVQYSIRLEGDNRRTAQEWHGQIRLPLKASSIATVEITWTPRSAGVLPMPQFLLPDVPHQEIFDAGDPTYSAHLLTVNS